MPASAGMTHRRDLVIAGALALGVLISRVPFRSAMLYHWDSINFARALDRFDVAAAQPQIPGYLLYVLIGRAARWLDGDAQSALVTLSMIGSALAVATLYLLGLALFDRRTALIAALGLGTSPLFWFYGEVALPHCLDAWLIITAVWLSWRILCGEHRLLAPFAAWLALTGGVRPQSETFLLPLTLYVVWHVGWQRRLVLAGAVWIICNLAWLIPLLLLSGGAAAYSRTSSEFYARFSATTNIWSGGLWGLTRNSIKLGMYSAYGWGVGLLSLAVLGLQPKSLRACLPAPRPAVFVLWLLPPLTVYLFVHMGQQGLVFVFLPALFLLSAALLRVLPITMGGLLAAILIGANALIFLAAPTYPLGGDRPKLLTVDTVTQHDNDLRTRINAIRRQSPAHTIVISSEWRFPEFYLPSYALVRYSLGSRWEVNEGRPTAQEARWVEPARQGVEPDGDNQITVVLFDDALVPFNRSTDRLDWLPLDNGQRLGMLRLRPNEALHLDGEQFSVATSIARQ